jgi:hypothetical protein
MRTNTIMLALGALSFIASPVSAQGEPPGRQPPGQDAGTAPGPAAGPFAGLDPRVIAALAGVAMAAGITAIVSKGRSSRGPRPTPASP